MPDIFISNNEDKKELPLKDILKNDSEENKKEKTEEVEQEVTGIPDEKNKAEESVRRLHKPPFEKLREQLAFKENDLPIHEKRPLSAFVFYPDGIEFETREAEEKVILFLRQHPVVNLPWIFLAIVMAFTPGFVAGFTLFELVPANFMFVFLLMWYLLTAAFTLEKFLTWFFNVYIVTDERIIDIDFYNLVYKEVSDANIDKIQDVTYNMGGVIRTFFNYGNVIIQTASEVPNFEFLAVPRPDKVARILQDLRMEEEQEKVEGRIR